MPKSKPSPKKIAYREMENPPGARGAHCIGAFDGSAPVGYITWDEPEEIDRENPYVHVLYVYPGYRGQGIGKALAHGAVLTRSDRDLDSTLAAADFDPMIPEGRAFIAALGGKTPDVVNSVRPKPTTKPASSQG